MKKVLAVLLCFLLAGCATLLADVRASQYIQQGKIYAGMSKSEFRTLMPEPSTGKRTISSAQGTREVWTYEANILSYSTTSYSFTFDTDGKLTDWENF